LIRKDETGQEVLTERASANVIILVASFKSQGRAISKVK